MDGWREDGRRGRGWGVPLENVGEESASEPESESEDERDEVKLGDEEGGVEDEGEDEPANNGKKRKRAVTIGRARKNKRVKPNTTPRKAKRIPHPQSSSSHLPSSVLSPAELPVDPYQRALRLLHVGATPESLPCREEEYVDVLNKVEEGVEGGGGGCLC